MERVDRAYFISTLSKGGKNRILLQKPALVNTHPVR